MDSKFSETFADGPWTEDMQKHKDDEYYWFDGRYACSMKRSLGGHWCGYVTMPETHPLWDGKRVNRASRLDVHGGITFRESRTIGFDMAHSGDAVPTRPGGYIPHQNKDGMYRDLDYVQNEIRKLVRQLRRIAKSFTAKISE
jgi:hypothetical protein